MNDTTQILEFSYNQPLLLLKLNVYLLMILIIFIVISYFGVHYLFIENNKKNFKPFKIRLTKFTLNSKGTGVEYEIERNYENLEIAHRIYTELITRKAAIKIDDENDVIKEIYDSWYVLFKVTRDEIKTLSGKSLQDKKRSDELIKMATDILNEGLRPHLTLYQAKFRKWYDEELAKESSKGKSPQEIQKKFPKYNELKASMENVNQILIEYSEQLHSFITDDVKLQ